MNTDFQRLMSEATRLTHTGDLQAATAAIQRALGAATPGGFASPYTAPAAAQTTAASGPMSRGDAAGLILDGLTRVIDDPVVPDEASTVAGAGGGAAAGAGGGVNAPAAADAGPAAQADRAATARAGHRRDTAVDRAHPASEPVSPATARAAQPVGAAPSETETETKTATAPASTSNTRVASAESWTAGSFTHQGRTLAYKLYEPPRAADAAAGPLLLMLHGCTQNPDDFAAGTRMNELARDLGVTVLYPAQTQHANAQQCWNWFKSQHQSRERGEPALLAALTRSVMAQHAIDPARVYVAGLSAGGAMADILGRTHADLFAAVGVHSGLPAGTASDLVSALAAMRNGPGTVAAPMRNGAVGAMAGGLPGALPSDPLATVKRNRGGIGIVGARLHGGPLGVASATRAPGAPDAPPNVTRPPTIVFHGDADSTVHPRNGAAVAAADGTPRVTEGQSAGGQRFTRSMYAPTASHGAVELWVVHGAGHAWSGGSARGSYTEPRGADASAEMLRFFLAHSMQDAHAHA